MKITKDFEDDHIIEQMKMREIIEGAEKGELDLDLMVRPEGWVCKKIRETQAIH